MPSEVTTETMTSTCTTLFDGTKRSTTLTSGGETSYRLYLGSFVLNRASSSAGDTTYRYQNTSFAMGRICRSSQEVPAVRVYVPDHLGSTAEIFENNSSVVEENDYYPFGLRTDNQARNKSAGNLWRFCGKEELPLPDDGSHLDFGARIYDAGTGVRWLSVDPLADKHPEMSPYSYCNNDPVNNIDPDGRDWYEDDDLIISWTNFTSQEQMEQNDVRGRYLGNTVVVFNGSYDEKLGEDGKLTGEHAIPARVTIYGKSKEDVVNYDGLSVSSDVLRGKSIEIREDGCLVSSEGIIENGTIAILDATILVMRRLTHH